MKIVADENIPFVKELFTHLGTVISLPGREMTPDLLADADVLLVRSITRVNEKLLTGSNVRFVGTATIGTDHIDQAYLKEKTIAFTSAAGSNSNSVAEYIITALLLLAHKHNWNLADKTLGIIGLGNIGSKLEKKAQILGMRVLPNDPPLQRATGDQRFVELDEILQADFITCHVPLTHAGPDPTFHLINNEKLARIKPGTTLLNTSRGPVVDNNALLANFRTGTHLGPVVLDVWENEPTINTELLDNVAIATPHIAGYSFDGKVNGSAMLHNQLCKFLEIPDNSRIEDLMPTPPVPQITIDTTNSSDQQLITSAMMRIYDILRDDLHLRGLTQEPIEKQGQYFDTLRKQYPIRRESHNTKVILNPPHPKLAEKLNALGFKLG